LQIGLGLDSHRFRYLSICLRLAGQVRVLLNISQRWENAENDVIVVFGQALLQEQLQPTAGRLATGAVKGIVKFADRAQHVTNNLVIIAGGGIGGLATALTLHQIGVPCIVFEAVQDMRPLGVGINMQPNAVRELYDLGITEADLDRVGLPAKEWALVGLNGNDTYSEPRGLGAGYNWPQYAVHRGQFHMLLHDKVVERIGPDAVRLESKVIGYRKGPDGSVSALIERADARPSKRAVRCWSALTAPTRRSGRRCIPPSRRSTGAGRSCGVARPGRNRYGPAPPLSVSARIATVWSFIRSRVPTHRRASR
jgi:hypothetical protein